MNEVKGTRKEEAVTIGTQKARQGVTGHNVRYVLMFSMIGAVLAMAATVVIIGAN